MNVIEFIQYGWLFEISRFASRIGASSSHVYPVIRIRDGECVKWYVRDVGWLAPDGTSLS